MTPHIVALFALAPLAIAAYAEDAIVFQTDHGMLVIQLFDDIAPQETGRLIQQVTDGRYTGMPFHYIHPGFRVTAGYPDASGHVAPRFNDITHVRGTVTIDPEAPGLLHIMHGDAYHMDLRHIPVGRLVLPRSYDTIDSIAAIPSTNGIPGEFPIIQYALVVPNIHLADQSPPERVKPLDKFHDGGGYTVTFPEGWTVQSRPYTGVPDVAAVGPPGPDGIPYIWGYGAGKAISYMADTLQAPHIASILQRTYTTADGSSARILDLTYDGESGPIRIAYTFHHTPYVFASNSPDATYSMLDTLHLESPRAITGKVTAVANGDTLRVDGIKYNTALADAPELGSPGYRAAKEFTASVCPVDADATVIIDHANKNPRFPDIIFAEITCNGANLNAALLESAHATLYQKGCHSSVFAGSWWSTCHNTISGTVTDIMDGDSIRVNGTIINPTLVDTDDTPDTPAKSITELICPVGSPITYRTDLPQPGFWNMTFAEITCGGIILNQVLLESGSGTFVDEYCQYSLFAGAPWSRCEPPG